MLLQHRFNQVDSQISTVQDQIRQLQEELSQLQTHRQNLQSVEQACESALTQVDTALAMLNHIDPDCIQTFKDAILAKFDTEIAQLPASQEPMEPESEAEPINPNSDDEAITVDITEDSWSDLGVDLQLSDSEIEELEPQSEEKQLQSVGSAAFDIKTASIEQIKGYCLDYITEDTARTYGSLTRKATWKAIAKAILKGELQPLNS